MADEEKKHNFDIKDCVCDYVVVYQDSAEICRAFKVPVKKGENEVILGGVSDLVDKDSIRVDGKGSAIILEVSLQTKHLSKDEQSNNQDKVSSLEKELEGLRQEETLISNKLERFRKERNVLNGFADQLVSRKPDEKGNISLSKDVLDSMVQFFNMYDEQATKFDKGFQDTEQELIKIRDQINTIRKNIRELSRGSSSKESSYISILMESSEDEEVELQVIYLVTNASWTPKYDLRVDGKDRQLKLHYYGYIKQSTGEDWNETQLTLSTAKPSVGGQIPSLGIQNVRFKEKIVPLMRKSLWGQSSRSATPKKKMLMNALAAPPAMNMVADGPMMEAEGYMMDTTAEPEMATMTMEAKSNLLSTMFEIPRKASIPSDNTAHKVTVGIVDFKPQFSYACHPRLATDVYLKAKIVNDSTYAMIAGPANVFLDNNFICKTNLDDISPGEEFTCSLGTDASIKVTYPPVHIHHEKIGMFTKVHNKSHLQTIKVKNTRGEAIKLQLAEQLPRTSEEKIKVQLIEPKIQKNEKDTTSSPRFNSKLHHVIWDLDMQPNETVDLVLRYSLEYPAGEEIEFDVENVGKNED